AGARDRPAPAAHPRRADGGGRAPVLLARADQRADHEPARGARGDAGAHRARRRRSALVAARPPMRVLYFGTYERDYPRNAQVISCLRRAGVEVEEHHVGVWEGSRQNWRAGIGAIARLSLAELRLLRRPPGNFDALVVGYPGHFDLTAARRASRGRPVVFNPLVSLSDTFVADRGRFRDRSLPARALQAVDRHALREADL